jgi:ubiquinone/menaquinone biosynthesis C-methylase UbiE
MVEESEIKSRWETIPVGENVVGSLTRDFGGDYDAFFQAFDSWRYGRERHILPMLDRIDWRNKSVLEIGLGQGSDSEQLIKRGAIWSGIDLTEGSIQRVRTRLQLRQLPHDELKQASALQIPFPDKHFDIVFSHGVLHHIPDIFKAQREIRRVLKDDGRLIMMVYAKNSLNYQVAIKWVRRFGLALICVLSLPVSGIYREHKQRAKREGLLNYLKMKNFIHRSTDGPNNPYSKVYDHATLEADFPSFDIVKTEKNWMHAPPLPVHGLPGEKLVGWHLWAELRPRRN